MPNNDYAILTRDVLSEQRRTFQDFDGAAHRAFHGEGFMFQRLLAWVQRPNAQTRAVLRRALAEQRRLLPSRPHAVSLGASSVLQELGHHHKKLRHVHTQDEKGGRQGLSSSQSLSATMPVHLPCIGIHIRHGDIKHDFREGLRLDRSFDHFALLAKEVGHRLGINNFYLATDNATILETAADIYPEVSFHNFYMCAYT